jgi:hypothetical protein
VMLKRMTIRIEAMVFIDRIYLIYVTNPALS